MADISIIVSITGAAVNGNTQKGRDYLIQHPYILIDPERVDEVAGKMREDGLTVEISRP